MAGTIVVDRIESDGSYASTINVASQINFSSAPSIGGVTARFGLRNKLINGNFDLWQRGTSFSFVNNSYAPDRWVWIFDGTSSSTNTVTRQTFPIGQTDVPGNPKYFMRYTYGVTSTPNNYFRQQIEGVETLAGKTVTVSCWAKCASGTVAAYFENQQEFGTGGSPSSGVYGIGHADFTITTSWQKFTFTHTLPSISGKTIGTSANQGSVNPSFYFPTNAGNTVDFAQIQLEEGSVATSFEERPIGLETTLAQRYYFRGSLYGGGCSSGSTSQYIGINFPVTMRTSPTVSWISGGRIGNGSTDTAVTGISALIGTGPASASVNFTTSSFGSGAQGIVLYNEPVIVLNAEF